MRARGDGRGGTRWRRFSLKEIGPVRARFCPECGEPTGGARVLLQLWTWRGNGADIHELASSTRYGPEAVAALQRDRLRKDRVARRAVGCCCWSPVGRLLSRRLLSR